MMGRAGCSVGFCPDSIASARTGRKGSRGIATSQGRPVWACARVPHRANGSLADGALTHRQPRDEIRLVPAPATVVTTPHCARGAPLHLDITEIYVVGGCERAGAGFCQPSSDEVAWGRQHDRLDALEHACSLLPCVPLALAIPSSVRVGSLSHTDRRFLTRSHRESPSGSCPCSTADALMQAAILPETPPLPVTRAPSCQHASRSIRNRW